MDNCNVRNVALELGALEIITNSSSSKSDTNKEACVTQMFSYLVVLDFEATCWETKPTRRNQNEIIEFAAVLLRIPDGQIVATFKKYVKPTENPELSAFCTSLTGIKQSMVNNAATIGDVLIVFDSWLQDNGAMHSFEFVATAAGYRDHQRQHHQGRKNHKRWCTFATWSDWDLGKCLRKECKRKRVTRSAYFNQWIDVRKMYVELYKEKPMGLLGALHSVGMKFVGQEHCGIDDARNTAFLVNQMIADGCYLINTKSI